MEVVITPTPDAAAEVVAGVVERLLRSEQRPVLGLATGSSPLPAYRELIERHRHYDLTFASAQAFLLDEYVGLPADHAQSYRRFIQRELTDHVDLPAGALHGPDVASTDPASIGPRYEQLIAEAGGIDLQLLGIGHDGHIGFNEPSSSLASRTRFKTLTTITRQANARFFNGDVEAVPRHVVTQGIGTILDARHLVLVATGHDKRQPIAAAVEGPITAAVPASALQLHPHVTVVVDESAAQDLRHARYYRETYAAKPPWQHL